MNFVGQNPSAKLNSPRRTRTADTMVNSHLLYQLSYGGMLMLIITYPVRNCKLNLTFLQNFQKDYFFGNNGSARLVEALAGSVAPCAWLKARQNLLNYTPSQFQRQIKFRSPSDYRDGVFQNASVFSTRTQLRNPKRPVCLSFHSHHVSTNPNHPSTP